ncbi:MAG: hypothetical protein IKT16_08250 [Desulfovibrio sp.]|nr:hypothetical protein [Desulfovibrio sp.]
MFRLARGLVLALALAASQLMWPGGASCLAGTQQAGAVQDRGRLAEEKIRSLLGPVFGSSHVVVQAAHGEAGTRVSVVVDAARLGASALSPKALQAEQERLASLCEACAGLDQARGDGVEVAFMPFASDWHALPAAMAACALLAAGALAYAGFRRRKQPLQPAPLRQAPDPLQSAESPQAASAGRTERSGEGEGRERPGQAEEKDQGSCRLRQEADAASKSGDGNLTPVSGDGALLACLLAKESPQMRAFALTLADPACAAQMLAGWPEDRQVETLVELVRLGRARQASAALVEAELAAEFAEAVGRPVRFAGARKGEGGPAQAAGVLVQLGQGAREVLLERMTERDAASARLVRTLLQA